MTGSYADGGKRLAETSFSVFFWIGIWSVMNLIVDKYAPAWNKQMVIYALMFVISSILLIVLYPYIATT